MKTKSEVIEQMRTMADRACSESKRVGGVKAVALLLEWNAWKRAASMVAEIQTVREGEDKADGNERR